MAVKKRERSFLAVCALVVLGLIFFEPAYGWKARAWLTASMNNAAPGALNNGSGIIELTAENEALKSQLAQFGAIAAQLPTSSVNYIRAMVYSRYPWNFKNELTVNVGTADGVAVGKAAVFNGILIGTVSQVFPHEAVITTVFDTAFKLPLRIGTPGADALLVGGASPRATLIAKKAPVTTGDVAYAAAPGMPYGLAVGIVAATTTSPDNLFEEAPLNFAYDLNLVQTVLIAK